MMRSRNLFVLALGVPIVAALALFWRFQGSAVDAQSDSLPRFGVPVVLTGADLPILIGASTDEIWGYSYFSSGHGPVGLLPVRVQVDERDDKGIFVEQEDGILDENDEVVAMYWSLGQDELPKEGWPTGIPADAPAVEVLVTDPLRSFPQDPRSAAWLYLFAAPEPADLELGEPIMRHDVSAGFIGSSDYEMVFASARNDGFIGPKELRAFGSPTDLIDRFKIRMTLIVLFGLRQEVNEEDIAAQSGSLGLTDPPRRLGPLRVILDDQGLNQAYESRVTLFRGAFDDSDLPLGVDGIDAVRLSLDLSPEAIGNRYYDSNLEAAGVPIDGMPDVVPERPIPDWRWIELPGGKLIFLPQPGASDSSAKNLFRDGGDREDGDTGDGRHVGESGVDAASVVAFVEADFPGEMIFVRDDYEVDVTKLVAESKAPLALRVERWGDAPALVTGTATVATRSTPTPTAGATIGSPTPVEASPTEGGGDEVQTLYLPWLARN